MKKSILSLAVATGLMTAGAAQAAPTVYGFIDVALVDVDTAANLNIVSTTSAFGVKGSEDLGDGMKAIYKMEFQVDVMNRCNSTNSVTTPTAINDANADGIVNVNEVTPGTISNTGCDAIVDRDQFVGLKGGMGTLKVGTMTNNWKQMGSKIDPFYRTPLQMRSVGQQSRLHRGAGLNGGRSTNTVQYVSPKMGGIQMVANTTIGGNANETSGFGIRYSSKMFTVWADMLSVGPATNGTVANQSGTKLGALIKAAKGLKIGLQFEQTQDLLTADVMSFSATYAIDKSNTVAFTWGETDGDGSGFNLGLFHKLSKRTSVYVAYNDTSDDTAKSLDISNDSSTFALGLRKKF